jgi:hypothetical protein
VGKLLPRDAPSARTNGIVLETVRSELGRPINHYVKSFQPIKKRKERRMLMLNCLRKIRFLSQKAMEQRRIKGP